MRNDHYSTLRADIEQEFKGSDPDLGTAVLCLYEAAWILKDKMPVLSALPAVAIDEIRQRLGGDKQTAEGGQTATRHLA